MYVFQLRLNEILKSQSKTPTDLSRAIGVRYPTIHKLSRPNARLERMDANLLALICQELEVTLEQLGRLVNDETGEELVILCKGTSEAPTESPAETPQEIPEEEEERDDDDKVLWTPPPIPKKLTAKSEPVPEPEPADDYNPFPEDEEPCNEEDDPCDDDFGWKLQSIQGSCANHPELMEERIQELKKEYGFC